jgi:hypothetical protein
MQAFPSQQSSLEMQDLIPEGLQPANDNVPHNSQNNSSNSNSNSSSRQAG